MNPKTVEKKYPSAMPLYISAAAFLLCSLIFPVYRMSGILIAAGLTLIIFAVARKVFPPRVVQTELPADPFATGDEALDAALENAQKDLAALKILNDRIPDEALSAEITRMENAGASILEQIRRHPEQARSIRRFAAYYLPTAVKILSTYAELAASGAAGENAQSLMQEVEGNARTIAGAFEAQLDALFAGRMLDVSAEIEVLDGMLSGAGLVNRNQPETR